MFEVMTVDQITRDKECDASEVAELRDIQLALVGGGVGEVVFA